MRSNFAGWRAQVGRQARGETPEEKKEESKVTGLEDLLA